MTKQLSTVVNMNENCNQIWKINPNQLLQLTTKKSLFKTIIKGQNSKKELLSLQFLLFVKSIDRHRVGQHKS